MNTSKMVQMVQNYPKEIEWIIKSYSDAKGFIHGFQKDVIQNALGAKLGKKFEDWKCKIYTLDNNIGNYVIIEDFGTTGLTGPIYTNTELKQYTQINKELPEEFRLARFLTRNYSSASQAGAGLYGVGKIMYSAASIDSTYFFDSLREDELYVSGIVEKGQILEVAAFQNDEAMNYLLKSTGLNKINHIGTRIIISNPKNEIVEAINSGELLKNASETWWRILPKMGTDSYIEIGGKKVVIPLQYRNDYLERKHYYEIPRFEKYLDGYTVTKAGFGIVNKLPQELQGFSFYRKGMKIGEIKINDIPDNIKTQLFGFIEVDELWELELAGIENAVHYDIEKTKKSTKTYNNLKIYVNDFVQTHLQEWGIINKKNNDASILNRELNIIKHQLEDIFSTLGVESLGKGDFKNTFYVRWNKIVFPNTNSKVVYDDQKINYGFRVNNQKKVSRKFSISLHIKSNEGFHSVVLNENVVIEGNSFYSFENYIIINEENASKFMENFLVLIIRDLSSAKTIEKKLNFFYATKEREIDKRDFLLTLYSKQMPRKSDKRVNTNDEIRNIQYRIENNTAFDVNLLLNTRTHNMENNGELIEEISKNNILLIPFSEVIVDIGTVFFDQNIYEKKLLKGTIELRSSLICNKSIGDFDKGDKLSVYNFKIFFNKNEKTGIEDSFEVGQVDLPEKNERSWSEGRTNDWKILMNIGHAAFKLAEDGGYKKEYMFEQLLRRFVELYLKEASYNILGLNEETITNLTPQEVLEKVNNKIEEIYYKSLAQR